MRTVLRPTNTTDPTLSRIQDSMLSAINDLGVYKQDALQMDRSYSATVFAMVGETTIVGGPDAVRVQLPDATPQNCGQLLGIGREDTTRAITVSNGDTLPLTAGIRIYQSTGSAWLKWGL